MKINNANLIADIWHLSSKKLPAGALLYTLAMSIIVGILSSGFILLTYYQHLQWDKMEATAQIQSDVQSGIAYLQASQKSIPDFKNLPLVEQDKRTAVIEVKKQPWGLFELGISRAKIANQTAFKIVQLGHQLPEKEQLALYLADLSRPLSLAGNTRIRGTAFLPQAGIKRAYIEGQNFTGDRLVEGKIEKSQRILPELNQALIASNQQFLQESFTWSDSTIAYSAIQNQPTITNSFKNRSALIHHSDEIHIADQTYQGNLVIVSDIAVKVGSDAYLEDVLVYAPYIYIQDGFVGNAQFFASDTLEVGQGVQLQYPSVVVLLGSEKSDNHLLDIQAENTIVGEVIFNSKAGGRRDKSILKIGKDATIKGNVYSTHRVELKGDIYGSLTCPKFYLITAASTYENHLLNAIIDPKSLSKHYLGSTIFKKENTQKGIAKWLY